MVKDIKKIFEQPTFASKGGLKEFNDEQRAKGWESIGKEAPESTQFNVLQNDVERGVKYLYGQIREAIRSTSPNYVPDEMKATDLRDAIEGITKAQTAQAIQQAKNDAAAANKNAESRLAKAANLSDISDKRQARENLGLGKLALANDYPEASLSQKGIVQLSSATDSDSETIAATPKAVKAVMDLAASSAVKSVNGKKGEVQLTASDVAALAQTGGTVNGPLTVEGNAKFTGTDYLDKSGVITDKKNTVRETNGLRIRGIEGQHADLRYWEKIGQGASLKLNVISGKSNGEFDFRQNGEFRANGGAQFGGNIHVSWGGRTATFHENGDVTGPVWGGALSGYLNRTFVTNMRLTGIAWTGNIGNGEYLWHNGGVIVGIQSTANYATNLRVAVRYLQKWVGGTWVGIISD